MESAGQTALPSLNRILTEPKGKEAVQAECADLLGRLLVYATKEEWSGRQLALAIGIPDSSLRAISKGTRQPDHWMPALRAAANRLGA